VTRIEKNFRAWRRVMALQAGAGEVTVAFNFMSEHITPCSLVEVDRRFRGKYCLHHGADNGGSEYF
jgi:hypothetical protein